MHHHPAVKKTRQDTTITYVILAATCCYFAIFSWLAPLYGDDLRFIYDWNLYSNNGAESVFTTVWRFARYMRDFDNARFDNIIACACLNLLPKWLTGLILGICAAAIAGLGSRLLNSFNSRTVLFITACLITVFPWRDGGMTTVIAFNMLVPSAITLTFLSILLRKQSFDSNRSTALLRAPARSCALLFAIIAGGIHEGYSATAIVGIFVYIFTQRPRFTTRFTALIIAYIIGMLWVLTSPGILMRAGVDDLGGWTLYGTLTMTMPLALFLATVFIYGLFNFQGLRQAAKSPSFLMFGAMLIASLAIAVKSGYNNPRAWWIPDFYATLLLTLLLKPYLHRIHKYLWLTACIVLVIFCGNVLHHQKLSADEHHEINAAIASSSSGTVYRNYTVTLPKTVMLQPVRNLWYDILHLNSANFQRADGRIESVVPPCMARLTSTQCQKLNALRNPGKEFSPADSTNHWWIFHGEILAPDSVIVEHFWNGEDLRQTATYTTVDYTMSDGSMMCNVPSCRQRFVTPSGDTLVWIHTIMRSVRPPYVKASPSR